MGRKMDDHRRGLQRICLLAGACLISTAVVWLPVSWAAPADEEPGAQKEAPSEESSSDGATAKKAASENAKPEAEASENSLPLDPMANPYLAPSDLTPEELVEFIQKRMRKPKTIRLRPEFVEALVDASQRVLDSDAADELTSVALLAQFETLQLASANGDNKAMEQLSKLASQWAEDPRPEISREARLITLADLLEQPDGVKPEDVPAVLEKLREYFQDEQPGERHLRLASGVVRMINLLPEERDSAKAYQTFGEIFSVSEYPRLARYGKSMLKLAQSMNLIGQPLELAGTLSDGSPLDWESYRGKIVLVDYWATWCGPCRKELPNVLAAYEKYHAHGFEVLGISLDEDPEALRKFLVDNEIPWKNLFGVDEAARGWKHPMAVKYAVTAIPATMLVGRDGKVIAKNLRGEALAQRLAELLGEGDEAPSKDKPATDTPADDKPADDKQADDKPASDTPSDDKPSADDKPATETPMAEEGQSERSGAEESNGS